MEHFCVGFERWFSGKSNPHQVTFELWFYKLKVDRRARCNQRQVTFCLLPADSIPELFQEVSKWRTSRSPNSGNWCLHRPSTSGRDCSPTCSRRDCHQTPIWPAQRSWFVISWNDTWKTGTKTTNLGIKIRTVDLLMARNAVASIASCEPELVLVRTQMTQEFAVALRMNWENWQRRRHQRHIQNLQVATARYSCAATCCYSLATN